MKIIDFIDGKVTYDNYGQYFWVNDANEGQQMLAELRGWGRIQNMFKDKGKYDLDAAEKFQDELGEWVASAINEKLERETEQNLLNKPHVMQRSEQLAEFENWLKENYNAFKIPQNIKDDYIFDR
jgi:hypothetical protein